MDFSMLTHLGALPLEPCKEAVAPAGAVGWLIKHFVGGGWGMYPISLCAVAMLYVLADRIIVLYFKGTMNKDAFVRGLKRYIYAGDLDKAIGYVDSQKPTPLSAVIKAGLAHVAKGETAVQSAMDEAALREKPKLERRTGYLAMIGNAAMLAGLLGTVSGLITCFEAVAKGTLLAGGCVRDKATILADGISEAMNCTAFGLLTAIPALVLFSFLMGRTQHILDDLDETSVGILNLILSNKEKLKMPV